MSEFFKIDQVSSGWFEGVVTDKSKSIYFSASYLTDFPNDLMNAMLYALQELVQLGEGVFGIFSPIPKAHSPFVIFGEVRGHAALVVYDSNHTISLLSVCRSSCLPEARQVHIRAGALYLRQDRSWWIP